jgi:putative transposase
MVKPLSLDLRERVAAALSGGASVREAAKRFGVSVASAVRIGQLSRSSRGLAARKIGGNKLPVLRGALAGVVKRRLEEKHDWTVRDLAVALQADGIMVSHDTVWRFLRREGLSFKKNSDGQRDPSSQGGAVPDALESPSAPA